MLDVVHREPGQRHRAQREHADRCGAAPSPRAALHQPQRERADPAGDQHRSERVGRRHLVARHRRQPPPADEQREQADRHVDKEHPAPARGHQDAADDRPQRRRDPADRRPGADRAMAAFRRGGREDQAQRGRRQQSGAGGLHHAECHEHRQAGRGAARRRCRHEHRHAEQEAPIAAVAVGEPAEQHQQRGVHDRVRVEDPRHVSEPVGADVEVHCHLRQRDVDDEQVEAREHDAGADDHQHEVGGRVSPGLCGRVRSIPHWSAADTALESWLSLGIARHPTMLT